MMVDILWIYSTRIAYVMTARELHEYHSMSQGKTEDEDIDKTLDRHCEGLSHSRLRIAWPLFSIILATYSSTCNVYVTLSRGHPIMCVGSCLAR